MIASLLVAAVVPAFLGGVAGLARGAPSLAQAAHAEPLNGSFSVSIYDSASAGSVPLSVSFGANLSGGSSPFSYNWSFGDGAHSTAANPTHTYSSTGTYGVQLTVTDGVGYQATSNSLSVVVTAGSTGGHLQAYANSSVVSGSAPLSVLFQGGATGGAPPYTYNWTFGDSNVSRVQNPSHTYTYAGTFPVSLDVRDSQHNSSFANLTIVVNSGFSVSVAAAPNSGNAPLAVNFTTTVNGGTAPYSYQWYFGDGGYGSNADPSHTYTADGTYTARVIVNDSADVSATASVVVQVGSTGGNCTGNGTSCPLAAAISASPTSGAAPLGVSFVGSATGGTGIYSYTWNFGDGASGTGATIFHTYANPGTYQATLSVTDSSGAVASAKVTITAANCTGNGSCALTAAASASSTQGPSPLSVVFTGVATGGFAPYTFNWNFGDGYSATGATVSHAYDTLGSFVCTLTVSDASGQTASASITITVLSNTTGNGSSPLTVGASASPYSGSAPLTVAFTGTASGGISPYSWAWNFGDGAASSAQDPSHTYTAGGDYQATLLVSDPAGATGVASVWISVNGTGPGTNDTSGNLTVSALASPTSGTSPLTVAFTGGVSGGTSPYSYAWQFGDGSGSNLKSPTHTYNGQGTFSVSFQVTDARGQSAASYLTLSVSPPSGCGNCSPEPTVSAPSSTVVGQTVTFTATIPASSGTYSFYWNFGDGSTTSLSVAGNPSASTTVTASHTYAAPGTYHVECLVNGKNESPSSGAVTVTVTKASVISPPQEKTSSSSGSTVPVWELAALVGLAAVAALAGLAMYYRGRRKIKGEPESEASSADKGETLDPYSAYHSAVPTQEPPASSSSAAAAAPPPPPED